MALRPGKFGLSKNSSAAPPPVEMSEYCKFGWSSRRDSTKPVVSPPQIMVVASVFSPTSSATIVEEVA